MLSGNERRPLRNCLARAFDHSAMKQAATAFTVANMSPKLTLGLNQEQVQPALVDVANALSNSRKPAMTQTTIAFAA